MKKLDEDYTAGVLAGLPMFCVNRSYKIVSPSKFHKIQYIFEFNNGYGASVIEFNDRTWSNGQKYEVAVLKNENICYDSGVSEDVERGNEYDIHKILCKIEELKIIKRLDN